jgi:hypothetical protein
MASQRICWIRHASMLSSAEAVDQKQASDLERAYGTSAT